MTALEVQLQENIQLQKMPTADRSKLFAEDLVSHNDDVSQSSGGTMYYRKGVGKSLLKKLKKRSNGDTGFKF